MEIMIVILVIVAIYVLSGIKVVNQYQRGVVLTLGKFTGVREPGLRVVVPIFQTMMMVDVRSTPIDVPKQEVITKDNVTVGVDAVVYFRVINAPKAVLETTNYIYATSQFAQAALRDVTGNVDMDDLLAKREEISQQIKEIVDAETDKWGIDVENVKPSANAALTSSTPTAKKLLLKRWRRRRRSWQKPRARLTYAL